MTQLAPLEAVALKPDVALAPAAQQFMDLAGDGQLDLVVLDGPAPGFYERDDDEGWEPFRAVHVAAESSTGATRTCGSSTSTATATPTC